MQKVFFRAKHSMAGIEFLGLLSVLLQILHLDIPKPSRDNYTIFYYSNNRYFSTPLHVKLNEESNGTNYKAIPLVCEE